MKQAPRYRTKYGGHVPLSGPHYRFLEPHVPGRPDPIYQYSNTNGCYRKRYIMVDTVGFQDSDFNPCWHERYKGVHMLPRNIQVPLVGEGLYERRTTLYPRQLEDPAEDCRNASIPMGTWLEDFSARAENHFLVLVPTDDSLINFLIEAIEVCEGNVRILENLREKLLNMYGRFAKILERSGSLWLAWKFAIQPNIRDIKAMLNTYNRALKRLKWLRERNHKDTKVHYREGPREFELTNEFRVAPVFLETIIPDWADPVVQDVCVSEDSTAEVTLCAHAWIRFDIDDSLLEGITGLGITALIMQGLYNPLAIGWEAVPWSWLIDWFRTEKHKLTELRKSDINPFGQATILASGWSIKIKMRGTLNFKSRHILDDGEGHITYGDWHEYPNSGGYIYHLYSRQQGLPETSDSPFRIPILNGYNASIIAALVQQRSRRG